MKYQRHLISLVLFGTLALAGASCRGTEKTDGTVNTESTIYGSEQKDGYTENIQIKIDDLAIHIGKIKESRALVTTDAQAAFDTSVAELETKFGDFKQSFEGFKASSLASFMTEREKLNKALVGVEDLYFKILTDYELKF